MAQNASTMPISFVIDCRYSKNDTYIHWIVVVFFLTFIFVVLEIRRSWNARGSQRIMDIKRLQYAIVVNVWLVPMPLEFTAALASPLTVEMGREGMVPWMFIDLKVRGITKTTSNCYSWIANIRVIQVSFFWRNCANHASFDHVKNPILMKTPTFCLRCLTNLPKISSSFNTSYRVFARSTCVRFSFTFFIFLH